MDAPTFWSGHRRSVVEVRSRNASACIIVIRMRRSTRTKLAFRREAVRTLATMELVRVVGGDVALPFDSGKEMCPLQAAPASPPH